MVSASHHHHRPALVVICVILLALTFGVVVVGGNRVSAIVEHLDSTVTHPDGSRSTTVTTTNPDGSKTSTTTTTQADGTVSRASVTTNRPIMFPLQEGDGKCLMRCSAGGAPYLACRQLSTMSRDAMEKRDSASQQKLMDSVKLFETKFGDRQRKLCEFEIGNAFQKLMHTGKWSGI